MNLGQIQYHFKDDDVFISLMDKDQAPIVLRNIETKEGFTIIPYEEYYKRKLQEQISNKANNNKNSLKSNQQQNLPSSTKQQAATTTDADNLQLSTKRAKTE